MRTDRVSWHDQKGNWKPGFEESILSFVTPTRRSGRGGKSLACLTALMCLTFVVDFADAQLPGRMPAKVSPVIHPSSELTGRLAQADERLADQRYGEAFVLIQSILGSEQDYYIGDFLKDNNATTLKQEAERRLSQLPKDARNLYETQFGGIAAAKIEEARRKGDSEAIAELVSTYGMTIAGTDAIYRMAVEQLDRSEWGSAAILFERIRSDSLAERYLPQLNYQAALAWAGVGNEARSNERLREFVVMSAGKDLTVAGRLVPHHLSNEQREQILQQQLARIQPQDPLPVRGDWPIFPGSTRGIPRTAGATAVGGELWNKSTWDDSAIDVSEDEAQNLINWHQRIEYRLDSLMPRRLPVVQPIVVENRMIYRTPFGLCARNAQSGEFLWRSANTDTTLGMLRLTNGSTASPNDLDAALLTMRDRCYRDSTTGMISSDGVLVYAIEDGLSSDLRHYSMDINTTNKLVAYDIQGGKIIWERGGDRGGKSLEQSGTFFLGPPLVLDGILYCLCESQREIQIVALKCHPGNGHIQGRVEELWSQSLLGPELGLTISPRRRMAGLTPVCSGQMLICSTSNGVILAFDRARHRFLWATSYSSLGERTPNERQQMMFANPVASRNLAEKSDVENRWIDQILLVHRGKLLATPRDSADVLCLNLADGTIAWKTHFPQQRLYLAAADHDVLAVAETHRLRGLKLDSGEDLWSIVVAPQRIAGRGVMIENRYVVPLSNGELVSIDLRQGKIISRSLKNNAGKLGNLIVGNGRLISVSAHEACAFQPMIELEQRLAAMLAKNPKDPDAIGLRGELALDRGDLKSALSDLKFAIREKGSPRARLILGETLLQQLQSDVAGQRDQFDEIDLVLEDPRQRARFLDLCAKHLLESGNASKAMKYVLRLGTDPRFGDGIRVISDQRQVREANWLAGLVEGISTKLTAKELADLPEMETLRKHIKQLPASDERLQTLLTEFGGLPIGDEIASIIADQPMEDLPEVAISWLHRRTRHGDDEGRISAMQLLERYWLSRNMPARAALWAEARHQLAGVSALESGDGISPLENPWNDRVVEVTRSNQPPPPNHILPIELQQSTGIYFDRWSFEAELSTNSIRGRDSGCAVAWHFTGLPGVRNFAQANGMRYMESYGALAADRVVAVYNQTDYLLLEETSPNTIKRRFGEVLSDRNTSGRPMLVAKTLPNGRRSMDSNLPDSSRIAGLRDDMIVVQNGTSLVATDPRTNSILWTASTSIAHAEGLADDQYTCLLGTRANSGQLVRLSDGAVLARRNVGERMSRLWFRGRYLLREVSIKVEKDQPARKAWEYYDLLDDKTVWRIETDRDSVGVVVNNRDFFLWRSPGVIEIIDLSTGTVRDSIDHPTGDKKNLRIHVKRYRDQWIVFAGIFREPGPRNANSTGINLPNFTYLFEGTVLSIDMASGKKRWATDIELTGFDPTQPESLPLAIFSGNIPSPAETRFSILDLRSGDTIYGVTQKQTGGELIWSVDPQLHEMTSGLIYQWSVNLKFNPK